MWTPSPLPRSPRRYDVLKIGQEIEAKVVDFNEDDKKISLSIKALEAPEEDAVEAAEVHTEE